MAALEAAFVGMLMFSSVAVYITLDPPAANGTVNVQRQPVEDIVGDLLAGIAEVPTTEMYASLMEKIISRSVQGNLSTFDGVVDRSLPPNAECRLFLDNGHERRQLAGPTERLARESVSKSKLWRPAWAYSFNVPALDLISSQQPLALQGYEVAQGALVKEYGVPLQWTLTTDKGTYDRASILGVRAGPTTTLSMVDQAGRSGYTHSDVALSWVTTPVLALQQSGAPPSPTPFSLTGNNTFLNVTTVFGGLSVGYTLNFTGPDGLSYLLPVGSLNVPLTLSIPYPKPGAWTMTGSGPHTGNALFPATSRVYANVSNLEGVNSWTFTLREEAGKTLAPGVVLNFTFPMVFSDLTLTSTTQTGWRNISAGESFEEGAWVTTRLDQALNNASLNFQVHGRRPPNTGNAMYVIHATMGGGASGKASFILGLPAGTTTAANDIEHEMYVSAPKPQAPGSTATWGAAFPNPRLLPGDTEVVQRLDVRTTDGTALFAQAPTGLTPTSAGWSLVDPTHLRWTGSQALASNQVLGFSFKVKTTAAAGHDEPGLEVPVSFEGGTRFKMLHMEHPYVYTVNIPPPVDILGSQQAGYRVPDNAGPSQRGDTTANVSLVLRGQRVEGSAAYGVTTFGTTASIQESLRLGVARSHLDLTRSAVKIGEEVNVTVDFQGLYDEITLLGGTVTGWNVDVMIFDPAQPFVPFAEMTPSFHGNFGAGSTQFNVVPQLQVQGLADWSLAALPQVKSFAKANVTFAPPRDAFFGPHAIVAQANLVINDGLGTSMSQAVRQIAVIDVLPDGGQSGTALYWILLECWLPDW